MRKLTLVVLLALAASACTDAATSPSPSFDETCTETQGSSTRCH